MIFKKINFLALILILISFGFSVSGLTNYFESNNVDWEYEHWESSSTYLVF